MIIMKQSKSNNINYIKTKEELHSFFTEEYYHSINYINYTDRTEKYDNTSYELVRHFNMTSSTSILDYGCAVGMLLDGFKKSGISHLSGYDISKWAIDNKINSTINTTTNFNILTNGFDFTFSLDVFEHMFDDDIEKVFNTLCTKFLVVRIPVKIKGDSDFYLNVSRRDKSHINCKSKGEWIDFIEHFGYRFLHILELPNIYDSKGCFCGTFISQ